MWSKEPNWKRAAPPCTHYLAGAGGGLCHCVPGVPFTALIQGSQTSPSTISDFTFHRLPQMVYHARPLPLKYSQWLFYPMIGLTLPTHPRRQARVNAKPHQQACAGRLRPPWSPPCSCFSSSSSLFLSVCKGLIVGLLPLKASMKTKG